MPRDQLGICAEGNLHSVYLMFHAVDGIEAQLRPCLANVAHYLFELSDQYADSAFNAFVAIGASYWDTLFASARPAQLTPFPMMNQKNRVAPATEFDLFVQLRCDRVDILHLVANEVCQMFDGLLELAEEERGFRYLDSRDFTGFVDGTENPKGRHRQDVALVGEEDINFRGGSYVHVQKYHHNLSKWNRLAVKHQEDVIGRTKQDNIEYESALKPLTCHIKRVNLKDEQGNSMEILRQSMPIGSVKHQGLMFISMCRTPVHFTEMLKSMIHGDGEGHHDHLLHFTDAQTGSAFFAPSLDFLLSFNEA